MPSAVADAPQQTKTDSNFAEKRAVMAWEDGRLRPGLSRFSHDHGHDGVEYFVDGDTPRGPARVSIRRTDHHCCVGFEQQQLAVVIEPEIYSGIVETERVLYPFKRRYRLVSKRGRHIAEKVRLFPSMLRSACHIRGEIMHL